MGHDTVEIKRRAKRWLDRNFSCQAGFEFLSSRRRSSSAPGMTFVFSVCRLVSRRCHSISALHGLYLSPSQNRTNGFPISGSSFNHAAVQKGSGSRARAPGASPPAVGLGGTRPRYTTGVSSADSAICTAPDVSEAYTADSSLRCPSSHRSSDAPAPASWPAEAGRP